MKASFHDAGDEALLDRVMTEKKIDAIIHFAGSIVVPESVADPLGYYLNNTVKSRALIESARRPASGQRTRGRRGRIQGGRSGR